MNPAVLKETFETGGQSLIVGASDFVDDLLHNGGRPRQVDTASFSLGKNLAATPGRVVMRNSLIELLMYEPQTDLVHAQPILWSGRNLTRKTCGELSFKAFKLPFSSVITLNAFVLSLLPAWEIQHSPLMLTATSCTLPLPGMTGVPFQKGNGGKHRT